MSPINQEHQREGATHRYEMCCEDSYRPYGNNIGLEFKFSIYKYCFLPFFLSTFFDRRLRAELTYFTEAQ